MMDWLIDTFIWTGALIALVLVLRQPVARLFGPKLAYALWSLPLLRLLLPPITLPSWMAPAEEALTSTGLAAAETGGAVVAIPMTTNADIAAPSAEPWLSPSEILLPIWVLGALAFLVWRWVEYNRMREELLRDAVPVGEKADIRLVESASVYSPIAFGVRDKVIALPKGFMSIEERHARDLAISHEIQHHRGRDLLANFAAQAVLALHWFNPLAWAGWRAMRRDQEAACDARVVEQCDAHDKAAYGEIIAGFAAGPRVALAAPMACPVLGEKSVIHRLRSLNMSDVSSRRRFAGRAALLGTVLALPLTASVTYAEDAVSQPRTFAGKLEVAQPAAPAYMAHEAQEEQQEAQSDQTVTIEDEDEDIEVIVIRDGDGDAAKKVRKIINRSTSEDSDSDTTSTFVWTNKDEESEEGAKVTTIKRHRHVFINSDTKMSDEERKELRESLKEMRSDLKSNGDLKNEIRVALAEAEGEVTSIELNCDGEGTGAVRADGKGKTVFICKSQIMASALGGLKAARDKIATDGSVPEEARGEILRSLDLEISRLEKDG